MACVSSTGRTRSVTPTEAGQRLLERLAPALGEIESGLDVVNGFRSSPRGTLKLNVPMIVAMKVLPPIATRFLAAHPGVTLEVAANDDLIDVVGQGFDAGVRYEERIERDMIAVPIGPRVQCFITAAAPSYLAAHGAPVHPRDLVNHACLRHRFPRGAVSDWQFERGDETVRVSVDGPLSASAIDLQLSAAAAGLGIDLHLRGVRAQGARSRRTRRGAGRLAAEFLRAVPLLSEPQHAGAFKGVRRFCAQGWGGAGKTGTV